MRHRTPVLELPPGDDAEDPSSRPEVAWRELLPVLDALPQGFLLCDRRGAVRHRNPAAQAALAADPQAARIEVEIRLRCIYLYAALLDPHLPRDDDWLRFPLQMGSGEYRLRLFLLTRPGGTEEAILVLLEGFTPALPSDSALRERFRLTSTELRVAHLLSEGRSNREIASLLFVSLHTARHHVEHVLRKLAVRSREEVAGVLRAAPPLP